MHKRLTISLEKTVYDGLHRAIGRRRIDRYIEALVRSHVADRQMKEAYRQMAQEEEREATALEWSEATIGDVRAYPR